MTKVEIETIKAASKNFSHEKVPSFNLLITPVLKLISVSSTFKCYLQDLYFCLKLIILKSFSISYSFFQMI